MWIYEQSTGRFLHDTAAGTIHLATGYSGYGEAKNRPECQQQPGLGPIPQGAYLIGSIEDNLKHGPLAIHLAPCVGAETWGRSGFLIHGDSIEAPGSASHGCIILPRKVREQVIDSHDKLLAVVSGKTAALAA